MARRDKALDLCVTERWPFRLLRTAEGFAAAAAGLWELQGRGPWCSELGPRRRLWAPVSDAQEGAGPGARQLEGSRVCYQPSWLLSDPRPAGTSASPVVNIPAALSERMNERVDRVPVQAVTAEYNSPARCSPESLPCQPLPSGKPQVGNGHKEGTRPGAQWLLVFELGQNTCFTK